LRARGEHPNPNSVLEEYGPIRVSLKIRRALAKRLRGAVAASFLLTSGAATATTTINHQFTPATINPGDVSVYKITIANTSLVPLTAAQVTEVFPSQITISSPVGITNTCGFTVNAATAGTSTVFLTGGTIPAHSGSTDGQCIFQLNVTATAPGNWQATIPANMVPTSSTSGYTAMENSVAVFNSTPATATLSVNTLSNPTGSKSFSTPALAGTPFTLTMVLTNPNASVTLPLTSVVDTLPTGMVVATPPGANLNCTGTGASNGTVTATAGSGTVTINAGTIGQSGTCTLTVSVLVASIAGTSQLFTNSLASGAIGNTRGLTSPAFSGGVTVVTPVNVTKSFATTTIPVNQPSLTTIVISNASAANTLPITSFNDNLTGTTLKILNTSSSPVAAPANPTVSCTGTGAVNGTLTAPPDLVDQVINLSGATAGKSGSCTLSLYLTSAIDGQHTNTIAANAVTNPGNFASPGPVTAVLTSNAQLTVTKSVTVANVAPGQWTEFIVTINNYSGGPVTNVNFKDVLPFNGANQMTLFDAGSGLFTAPGPGCTLGTFFGTNAAGTSTNVAPVAGDAGLLWTGGTIIGGVGLNPGVCTISIWAQLPASAATGLTFTNSIGMNSIMGTGGAGGVSNTNLASVNVVSIASGAVTKAFAPASIAQGGQSTLTLTLFNRTVSPLTGVNLTDNLPTGVTLAANPAATSTCTPPGSVQAFPNDTVVVLSGGTVAGRPAGSQESTCAITVKVTGTALGVKINTITPANFSNTQGVTIPANVTANLTITTGLGATKSFTPTTVAPGGVSHVKITVSNTSSGGLTNVSLNDSTFSAGLAVSNPANASTNCAGSPTLVANPGATNAQLLGATLAAGASCDFGFDVVTSGAGPWSNTIPIGAITSAQGLSNTAAVTANLTKTTAQININKSFNPVIVTGGFPSVLQIDVINPSTTVLNGVGLTDVFPPGIVVFPVPSASTDCPGGTVSAVPNGNQVTLSGATLAVGLTCHVFVTTTSLRFLNLTNTIPANSVTSAQGYTNPVGTSATLSTLQGLGVTKAFSPAYVVVGQVSTLEMSLVSTFDPSAPSPLVLTGLSYTDTLPVGVFIAATPNATTTCAGTGPGGLAVVNTSNGGSNGLVTISQGTIQPGTSCTISVDTVSNTLGAYNNLIPANAVTTDQGVPNSAPATATLFVVTSPTVSKSFANATRNPGQSSVMTVKITNGSSVPFTGVSLTDTLPPGLEIASTPATGGTCTTAGGVVAASAGGSTLSMSGATIAAGSNCTFFASVVGNTPGTYINNIPAQTVVTDQDLTNAGSAQATLTINAPPTISKAFNPVTILSGGTSTLTITLGNSNAASTTLSALFTDTLPGNVFVAATPNIQKTCAGVVTAPANGSTITYANGAAIPSGGCTISVDVTSSMNGTYTNLIAAGQLSTAVGVNQLPATASLAVGSGALVPPTLAKSFTPATIPVNGTSTVTITLGNPNGGALTLASDFTDTLPTNVVVISSPVIGGTCMSSGTVTAAASSGTITYGAGGTIPSGGCTITVGVTSPVGGSYTNTLPTTSLTTDGGSPTQPATAGLVVQSAVPPTLLKSFNPVTINPGDTSTLTITFGNSTAAANSVTSFTDNLPANVTIASAPSALTSCTGGTLTATPLSTSVTYSGGSIPPGGCTITVPVTSSTPGGPYVNTLGVGALQTGTGPNGSIVTAHLFVNPNQPPSASKSFSPAIIGAGGTSILSISLANGNATDATLTADFVDTLPGSGLVIATPSGLLVSAGCTAVDVVAVAGAGTVTYKSGGDLPANGGCTIQVNVTSSTVTTYTNTLAAGALKTTIGNTAVPSTATLQVLALPTVAKSFSPASIPLGASSSLTLTLGNSNAVALTLSAAFVDTLPPNLVLGTPATLTGTCPTANITAVAGSGSITYASGASIVAGGCTIVVPVTSATPGGYDNNIPAGALQTTIGVNPAPATAHLDILEADLSITKTDFTTIAVPGTTTTYSIVVANAGPSAVTSAPVVDTLPAAVTSDTWTCVPSVGSSCAAPSGTGNIATTVSLLAGGSATFTVVATISPAATGSLTNTATVTTPAGWFDPNIGNNTASDTDTLTPQADLSITKTDFSTTAVPGSTTTYTIVASNAGPSNVTNAAVVDTLPAAITSATWTCVASSGSSCGAANGTGSLATTASLLVSGTATYTVVATLSPSATGTLSNTATIAVPGGVTDPTPGNNAATDVDTLTPQADLTVVKTGPPTAVPGGPNLVFNLIVTNNGHSDAQGVSLSDPTPANLVFVSATPSTGSFNSGTGIWTIGPLVNGASVTMTLTYQIPSSYPAGTPVVNTATVTATTPDPNPGDNTSTATVLVPTGVADIAVAKTVSNAAPAVGTNVTYTITVSDLGPSDASGVAVTDVLPSGLTFVSASSSQGSYDPVSGVWTIGAIANGASKTLQIMVTVTQGGAIVNTATKTAGNETDPDPSNNSGTVVVNGPALIADIQVQKTVDNPAPASVPAVVNFTITAHNAGPSTATNVVVTDVLPTVPAGMSFLSATPSTGTYTAGTGAWAIGTMVNGATATLTITATVTAAGTYVNVAQKTGETEFDPNTGNDQGSAVVVAGGGGSPLADLSIQKTDSPDPVFAGQPLTYTLLVTNRGPSGATNVTITDPLPAGVSFVSAAASQGGCSGTTTVTCTLGGLAAGNSATVSLVVTALASGAPSVTNTASVAATETDPNPSDNTSTAPTTVIPVADVAIAKIVSNPAPLVSQTFTFTVTATNNGPSTANAVAVTDVLPGNLTLILATPSQGSYTAGTGLWTIGTLANGANATLVFTVLAAAPGAFMNVATKTGETELDPDTTNDSASASGGVGVVADLTIVKSHLPATFLRGSTGTFSLIVSNVGTGPTSGLMTVSDTLPTGLTPTLASGTGWSCGVAAPTVTCTRSDVLLVTHAWPAISVTASVAQSAAASLSNTGTVSGGGDITPGNDSSTDGVSIASQADLAITKMGPANTIPGNDIVYNLVVTNNGPSDATGVTVSDPTPTNLAFVPGGGTCGAGFPCTLGALASGASVAFTATFHVPAGYTAPTPIVNTASVSSTTTDTNLTNNSASASTSVSADLSVVKTIDTTPVVAGEPLTYRIVVTDNGPSPATGVTLTDPLPTGVTFQSLTTTQGTCSGTTTVTCALGSLADGASATVTITVLADSASASVTNTATAHANEFDPDPTNNVSTAGATFRGDIPTLSGWALLALTLALALAGARALKRGV
jgi:uncharacterized repeat protein (TIGR01451 family)